MRINIPCAAQLDRPAGDRQIWFRLCTPDVDSHGTIIEPGGVVLAVYRTNPVFCWMHPLSEEEVGTPGPERVIGRVVAIEQTPAALDICVLFAGHELADLCYEQVKGGFLQAVSIYGNVLREESRMVGGRRVTVYAALELLEASLVIVGSNKAALRLDRAAVLRALRAMRSVMDEQQLHEILGLQGKVEYEVAEKALLRWLASTDATPEQRAQVVTAFEQAYPPKMDKGTPEAKAEGGEGEDKQAARAEGTGEADKGEEEEEAKEAQRLVKRALQSRAQAAAEVEVSKVDELIKAGRLPQDERAKWIAQPDKAQRVARSIPAGTFTTSQRLRSGKVGTPVEVEPVELDPAGVKTVARGLVKKARDLGASERRPAAGGTAKRVTDSAADVPDVRTTAQDLINKARAAR